MSEQRAADSEQQQKLIDELTFQIQQILISSDLRIDAIEESLKVIHLSLGIEAAALRLQEDDDFPYYVSCGFPSTFVEAERYLCCVDQQGNIVKNDQGIPVLECMCGNVIRGRFDPSLPFFTKHGSFWTNSTTDLLASTTEKDRQARTRNRCHGEGYESVALIPLSGPTGNIGLLQLNDKRRNRFTHELIDKLETLAAVLATGIERLLAIENLRNAKELADQIISKGPIGIVIADHSGMITFANRHAENILGISQETIKTRSHNDPEWKITDIHGNPFADEDLPFSQVMATDHAVYNIQHAIHFPDGTQRILSINAAPLHSKQGSIKQVLFAIMDITERKKTEKELQKSERDLRRAQELAQIGSWRFQLDTHRVIASSQTREIYGLDDQEWTISQVQQVPLPKYRDALDTELKNLINDNKPYDIEFEIRRPSDGKIRHIHSVAEYDAEQKMVIGAIQDITRQHEMEQQLRQMEKMDAIGKLAGGIAHDFNNQLTSIIGYADMLENEPEESDIELYARQILIAARRAADLTNKLLAFARKGQFQSIPVDLHAIIGEVTNILSHSIDKRIAVRHNLKADPCTTRGDPGQIQNALLNLAINAADAMPEGGNLTFETSIRTLDDDYCSSLPYKVVPGQYVLVNVTDTGCGIPSECLDNIFEPFFTTKEIGKGTGLGLAAVYGTVKHHGGSINVYSEIGHGTTFRLYLPLETAPVPQKQDTAVVYPSNADAMVLIIDDEEAVCTAAKKMLSSLGYHVITFNRPETGISYYRRHWQDIDLVILDLIMPGMNGQEAYRILHTINSGIKVLLASGYSINGEAQHLLDEGVQGFIQKPFARPELSARVAALLYGLNSTG